MPLLDTRKLKDRVAAELLEGRTDEEVALILGISEEEYVQAKKAMVEGKAKSLAERSKEEHFVDYMLRQERNIRQVEEVIESLEPAKCNTRLAAIKLKSDILDKVLSRGLDMGVIRREPERKEIVAGIAIYDLDKEELIAHVSSHVRRLSGMIKKYGDGAITALPAPETHRGEALDTTGEEVEEISKLKRQVKAEREPAKPKRTMQGRVSAGVGRKKKKP